MLYHVVLFALKDHLTEELEPLLGELRMLEQRVPVVRKVIAGPALAGSGYDGGLVVELDDRRALETYRSDPAHAPVLQQLRTVAERVEVADLETTD